MFIPSFYSISVTPSCCSGCGGLRDQRVSAFCDTPDGSPFPPDQSQSPTHTHTSPGELHFPHPAFCVYTHVYLILHTEFRQRMQMCKPRESERVGRMCQTISYWAEAQFQPKVTTTHLHSSPSCASLPPSPQIAFLTLSPVDILESTTCKICLLHASCKHASLQYPISMV